MQEKEGVTSVDKLQKILVTHNERSTDIEVIFVLGSPLKEELNDTQRLKSLMQGISSGSRIVHYDSLIRGAQNAYAEYLHKTAELDKIEQIVNQL